MASTVNIPLLGTLTYPLSDVLFSPLGREYRIPSKWVFGMAVIGGFMVIKKIFRFTANRVRRLVNRENKALTRRDGPEDFEDRTALITGADGLMGRGFAKELASRNFNLILVGHDSEKLETLVTEIQTDVGVAAVPIVTDMKDTMDMDTYRDKLIEYTKFKVIQVCINAERVRPEKELPFEDLDFALIKEQVAKNAIIPLITTQVAIANMKTNNVSDKKEIGVIINSTTGIVSKPNRNLPVYAGAHAFADYFTQSLAKSQIKDGIYMASVRQMCWGNTDEKGYMKFAEDTLREVFLDKQIHGGLVNTMKANVYDRVIHKIKG